VAGYIITLYFQCTGFTSQLKQPIKVTQELEFSETTLFALQLLMNQRESQ